MLIAAESLDPGALYKLITGIVVPRPIAWVTTISADKVVNLAPFSSFTFLSMTPPLIAFNVVGKRTGRKDTPTNIHANGEFVVHIADEPLMATLHASSAEFPPRVSEVERLGLATAPGVAVSVPRLVDAPISMECTLDQIVHFGKSKTEFIVGEIKMFHIRDGLCVDGKIETKKLRPIARLGGPVYATLGEIVKFTEPLL